MTDLIRIVDTINQIAPEALQETWDNSGIQINDDKNKKISKIITCLEINDDVITEAVNNKADMIVTHHPLIFSRVNQIDADDITGGHIIRLIKNGITVYSAHTSFDSALKGTNYYLADKLKLKNLSPMVPNLDFEDCGMGRYGEYDEAVDFDIFIERLKDVCSFGELRIAGKIPEAVKNVSICTGAGAEYISLASYLGSDVFITGDLRYHEARHAADMGFCVVDAGHYGTEVIFAENMAAQLKSELGNDVEIFPSAVNIDPFI